MTDQNTNNRPDQILNAALDIAAREGWGSVTLPRLTSETDLSLTDVLAVFDGIDGIVKSYLRRVDMTMLSACTSWEASDPVRDRLFDLLMERFDALNGNRAAACDLYSASYKRFDLGRVILCSTRRSAHWMISAAQIEAGGLKGVLHEAGLVTIMSYATRAWLTDDSADLSKTMAAVDKALSRADWIAQKLFA